MGKGAVKMNIEELRKYWTAEEEKAHIKGWDFSCIENRTYEGELPWKFEDIINKYRNSAGRLLDIDTGGGEFLLSIGHPYYLTSATEGYPPNAALCREKFRKLGIDFHEINSYNEMPFPDNYFDIIMNRHGSYDPDELYRVLKQGGVFVTQQVGEDNDRELVELLLPDAPKPYPGHDLANCTKALENTGFKILESSEAYRPLEFYDTGALVWFARIIEWEFTGFSVDKCFERLLEAERIIRETGKISGMIHRFYIVARKT